MKLEMCARDKIVTAGEPAGVRLVRKCLSQLWEKKTLLISIARY